MDGTPLSVASSVVDAMEVYASCGLCLVWRAPPPIQSPESPSFQSSHDAMSGTVSNGHGGVNVTHLQDFCINFNSLCHRIGFVEIRCNTVKGCSRADDIEVIVTAQKRPRRVGEAAPYRPRQGFDSAT